MTTPTPVLSRTVLLLAAVASGLAVATVYYAQPLLDAIAEDTRLSRATVGTVITWTQVGYGLGLLMIVPLGDVLDRRRLILVQTALSVAALLGVSLAGSGIAFLAGIFAVGMLAVVAQVHVAHAASLAPPHERGRAVGTVTSGIITGILLARAASGLLSDLWGWKSVYVAAAAAQLVVVMLLLRALPAQPVPGRPQPYLKLLLSVPRLFIEERMLRVRGGLALLVFMAITVLWTPMSLALRAPPHSLSHTVIGLFGFAGLLGALGARIAGTQADRGGAERTTGIALVLMAVAWLPMSMLSSGSVWGLIVGIVLIDFALQAVHVSNQSLIYRTRPEAQSRLTAAYMVCYSIGCAAGSIVSTLAFDRGGWPAVSMVGGGISVLALLQWLATRGTSPGRRLARG